MTSESRLRLTRFSAARRASEASTAHLQFVNSAPSAIFALPGSSSRDFEQALNKDHANRLKIPDDKAMTAEKFPPDAKNPQLLRAEGFSNMAQRTGLEPATPGVTGRYSNRLNYRCASVLARDWWVMTGSNRRPSACKADALPAELITRVALRGGEIYAPDSPKSTPCLKFFS